jgi:hypothetical protein
LRLATQKTASKFIPQLSGEQSLDDDFRPSPFGSVEVLKLDPHSGWVGLGGVVDLSRPDDAPIEAQRFF